MITPIPQPDRIVANLPAIDIDQTREFYDLLGFKCCYQSKVWMILKKGSLELEFFHHPELDPQQSWHSACLRINDLDRLYSEWQNSDLYQYPNAKLMPIEDADDLRIFCLIDINGSLLRCIQNP